MKIFLEHIRFDSILCKLDDNVVRDRGDYPQLESLAEVITEETAEALLYLHPMVVTPYRSDNHSKARYRLQTGLQSYLLARSVLDGQSVPVMVTEDGSTSDLHMINQLLARPLLSIDDKKLIKFWGDWRRDEKDQLSKLGKSMLRKDTESKLIGLKESTIRKIRRDMKRSWEGHNRLVDEPMTQASIFDDESS